MESNHFVKTFSEAVDFSSDGDVRRGRGMPSLRPGVRRGFGNPSPPAGSSSRACVPLVFCSCFASLLVLSPFSRTPCARLVGSEGCLAEIGVRGGISGIPPAHGYVFYTLPACDLRA